jgi:hypothetical protein
VAIFGKTTESCNHFIPAAKSNFVADCSTKLNFKHMPALKQFLLGLLVSLVLLFLGRSFICDLLCPAPPPQTCVIPNPEITFNVDGGSFSLFAHPVPNASSVKVDVFGKDGTLAGSFSPAIGTAQVVNVPNAQRPLQVVMVYQSGNNTEVARDSFHVDDRETGGTPIVEIVMGVQGGAGLQPCPNTTNTVTMATVSPIMTKMSWVPNKEYKIMIDHGTKDTLVLRTELNGLTGCYRAVVYAKNVIPCLTQPTTTNTSINELQVTTGSGNIKITGTDNCDGTMPREIFFRRSTLSGTVSVLSN